MGSASQAGLAQRRVFPRLKRSHKGADVFYRPVFHSLMTAATHQAMTMGLILAVAAMVVLSSGDAAFGNGSRPRGASGCLNPFQERRAHELHESTRIKNP